MANSVVEGLGWDIACSPRPGGGTSFSIVAPLAAEVPIGRDA